MREVLSDILKQTSSLFDILKVTATDTTTKLEATDKEATMFLQATLKQPIAEFKGEFGMNNLSMLNGLLSFPSYNTDGAKFTVGTGKHSGKDVVIQFKFEDERGGYSDYRLVMPNHVPDQAEILSIPWVMTFEPNKSRLNEFTQLSALYSKTAAGSLFMPKIEDGDLHFFIGEEESSDHSASIMFEPSVGVDLRGQIRFQTNLLLSAIKIAGSNPVKLSISDVGCLQVSIDTPHGDYNYILRGSRT